MKLFAKMVLLSAGLMLAVPSTADAADRKKKNADTEQQDFRDLKALEQDVETTEIINNILNRYTDWDRVTFSGKIRTSMVKLPVTPSVKIYAEKDQLFQLSLSAPFLGEVGRVEVTPETITAVNKYNKTYVQESAERLMEIYPGLIGDLQNLFLGRMVILGQGVFSLETLPTVTLTPIENEQWLLMPADVEESSLKYGYVVLPNGRTGALFGYMEGRPENVTLTYGYNGGIQMTVEIDKGGKGKNLSGTLDFSSVKWGGNRMSSVNLDRYRKVSFKEFVTNFK